MLPFYFCIHHLFLLTFPRLFNCATVSFAELASANIVGYNTTNVKAGQWYMVAAQFQGVAESNLKVKLSDLITTTLKPGTVGDGESDPTYANAPAIQVLKANGTGYDYYYYVNDAGVTGDDNDPWNATGWIDGSTFLLTDVTIDLSKGFWFYPSENGTVNCAGQVAAVDTFAKDILANTWQIVANPYPAAMGLNSIETTGFKPGTVGDGESDPTYANAPAIQVLKANGTGYDYYYYVDDAGVTGDDNDPWNATGWIDGSTFLLTTGIQVPAGQAFWINSASAGKFTFGL